MSNDRFDLDSLQKHILKDTLDTFHKMKEIPHFQNEVMKNMPADWKKISSFNKGMRRSNTYSAKNMKWISKSLSKVNQSAVQSKYAGSALNDKYMNWSSPVIKATLASDEITRAMMFSNSASAKAFGAGFNKKTMLAMRSVHSNELLLASRRYAKASVAAGFGSNAMDRLSASRPSDQLAISKIYNKTLGKHGAELLRDMGPIDADLVFGNSSVDLGTISQNDISNGILNFEDEYEDLTDEFEPTEEEKQEAVDAIKENKIADLSPRLRKWTLACLKKLALQIVAYISVIVLMNTSWGISCGFFLQDTLPNEAFELTEGSRGKQVHGVQYRCATMQGIVVRKSARRNNSRILAALDKGEMVQILEKKGHWSRVRLPDSGTSFGWVMTKYLKTVHLRG